MLPLQALVPLAILDGRARDRLLNAYVLDRHGLPCGDHVGPHARGGDDIAELFLRGPARQAGEFLRNSGVVRFPAGDQDRVDICGLGHVACSNPARAVRQLLQSCVQGGCQTGRNWHHLVVAQASSRVELCQFSGNRRGLQGAEAEELEGDCKSLVLSVQMCEPVHLVAKLALRLVLKGLWRLAGREQRARGAAHELPRRDEDAVLGAHHACAGAILAVAPCTHDVGGLQDDELDGLRVPLLVGRHCAELGEAHVLQVLVPHQEHASIARPQEIHHGFQVSPRRRATLPVVTAGAAPDHLQLVANFPCIKLLSVIHQRHGEHHDGPELLPSLLCLLRTP
mmetsp:Transcript_79395/g.199472  ORF Transcript_79395/g.199472 Transcript_79395/m.199472 type:complete len:339 (-) Transcript_79395:269-1285(-)